MRKPYRIAVYFILLLFLASCSAAAAEEPGKAVEAYFQAIVNADADGIAVVSCSEWESTARDEVASFAGVKARLDSVSCKTRSTEGETAVVDCTGAIIATYNNEDQNFDLSARPVKVVQSGGEWLVCGYGE